MPHDEEILDLVDKSDKVISQCSRREVYRQHLHNYRVVHGFLVNSKGQIWVPKRTASKKLFPNALDYSVAGHVETGETYDVAFRRETREEILIDLDRVPWRPLQKLTPANDAHCFQMIYEIRSDATPEYNRDDFSEARWMSPREIVERIEAGEEAKSDLAFTIKKFYPYMNNGGVL